MRNNQRAGWNELVNNLNERNEADSLTVPTVPEVTPEPEPEPVAVVAAPNELDEVKAQLAALQSMLSAVLVQQAPVTEAAPAAEGV